jgi:hypothetical protein
VCAGPGDTAHFGLSQITHFTPRHARDDRCMRPASAI